MADNVEMAENVEMVKNVESEIFGDAFGPDSEYVKLVAGDGHEFYMERRHATKAGTIASMLKFPELVDGCTMVDLRFIQSHILNMVCMCLMYVVHYADHPAIPDFDMPANTLVDMMKASHILNC